jgi:hypothetical protein
VTAVQDLNSELQDALKVLDTRLQKTYDDQSALRWSPPGLLKGLQAALSASSKLRASVKLTAGSGTGTAPKAGQKTDALSLGVGVSQKAAAKLSLGLRIGIGFSASASIAAKLVVGLKAATSGVGTLNRNLTTFNAAAKLKAGTNGVMPPGQHVDQGDVNKALRSLNDQLGTCQRHADAASDGAPVAPITAELRQPRVGPWHCELDLDTEATQNGKIKFKLDDIEFVGTVLPEHTGMEGARARCKVVGGNGHLSSNIDARSYSSASGVKVGTVLRDILKACGENLSDLSDADTLDRTLPRWQVAGGTAKDALTKLAEAVDGSWRVMRDGTVWFGVETWPEVAPDAVATHESWSNGVITLAPETPDMVPGTVYQGQRIEHVTHRYGTTLRTEVRTSSVSSALKQAFGSKQREIDFSREYPCKVVTQNPDGTLQLLPDDEIMRSAGLDHVSIRYGLPGFRAKLKNGARCHLAFAAGDPSRPYAHNWESDPDSVESLDYIVGGRAGALARVGDTVDVFVAPATPIAFTGTVTPPGAALAGFMTISTPLVAIISGGNGQITA